VTMLVLGDITPMECPNGMKKIPGPTHEKHLTKMEQHVCMQAQRGGPPHSFLKDLENLSERWSPESKRKLLPTNSGKFLKNSALFSTWPRLFMEGVIQ
jgi:hypothetical protein